MNIKDKVKKGGILKGMYQYLLVKQKSHRYLILLFSGDKNQHDRSENL